MGWGGGWLLRFHYGPEADVWSSIGCGRSAIWKLPCGARGCDYDRLLSAMNVQTIRLRLIRGRSLSRSIFCHYLLAVLQIQFCIVPRGRVKCACRLLALRSCLGRLGRDLVGWRLFVDDLDRRKRGHRNGSCHSMLSNGDRDVLFIEEGLLVAKVRPNQRRT